MWNVNFNSELLIALFLGAVSFLICYYGFYKRKNFSKVKKIALCLLHIYIFALVDLTLSSFVRYLGMLPDTFTPDFKQALLAVSLSPFGEAVQLWNNCKSTGAMGEFYRIIGGNLVLLFPLGILIPAIRRKSSFTLAIVISLLVPFAIEALQLLGNALVGEILRDVSLSDYFLNLVGCLIGFVLASFRFKRK